MGCAHKKPATTDDEEEHQRKIFIVGDGTVGKTCLIHQYLENEFAEDTPQTFIPTSLDVKIKQIDKNKNEKIDLMLYDTGGQESFAHLRKINYPKSDAVIICFDLSNPTSFEHVGAMWIPEIQKLCPDVPILLVGNKKDLRDEARSLENFVLSAKGERLAKKHKLIGYIECSSLTPENVDKAFQMIIDKVMKRKFKPRGASVT